jgi:hypothetical protein
VNAPESYTGVINTNMLRIAMTGSVTACSGAVRIGYQFRLQRGITCDSIDFHEA